MLQTVSRPENVIPDRSFRILGAHGLYVKNTTTGSGVQADRLYRVQKGDFVYNRLFAWKGSFALATNEHEGCYVSNEFPCFTVDSKRLDGRFLWRYFSCPPVWDRALAFSKGGTPTSRNRLKEDKFLAFTIPLPPLDEQRRIVARIEALAAKIEEARGLRQDKVNQTQALVASTIDAAFRSRPGWTRARVSEFCEQPQYGYTSSAVTDPVGPRLLRITDTQNGQVNWDSVPFCICPDPEKYLLKDGISFSPAREQQQERALLLRIAQKQFLPPT